MLTCDLSIRLDREDRTFQPGDAIHGEVIVRANENVSCKALTIELGWATHGAGNVDQRTLDTHIERELHWMAGHDHSHRFRFRAPSRPLTYRGQILNVDQQIRASAVVGRAIDPRASEDYVLLPGSRSREEYLAGPREESWPAPTTSTVLKVLLWIFMVVLLLMGVVLFLAVAPFLLAVFLFRYVRKRFAERKLGIVEFEIDAPVALDGRDQGAIIGRVQSWMWKKGKKLTYGITPGEPAELRIRFRPPDSVDVTKATARLLGQERCHAGGTPIVIHDHEIHKEEIVLVEQKRYRAAELVDLRATFSLPDTPAYTFVSSSNHLEWKIELEIEIPNWPTWVEEIQLRMVPA